MLRLLAAALLLCATPALAQDPNAAPPKPADAPPAAAPADANKPPSDAPPADAKASDTPPPAAAKDAPAAAEVPAKAEAGAKDCHEETMTKPIDDALAAIKANAAYGQAGGNLKKAEVQLQAAKKSVSRGCAVYAKPAKAKAKPKGPKAASKAG